MSNRWMLAGSLALLLALLTYGGRWPGVANAPPQSEQAVSSAAPAAEGCRRLAAMEPVHVLVDTSGLAPGKAGTGYREPGSDRVLVPVRPVVAPLAPGPLGVHWEEKDRTATMMRDGNVISIHFPDGKVVTTFAIVNGEVVPATSVLCDGRLYASLQLLAEGLGLRWMWRDSQSALVAPR